jgi:RNA-directed DNA polymerase
MSFFDKFKKFFGGSDPWPPSPPPARVGDDLHYPVTLSSDQAARGTTLELRLQYADGSLNETLSVRVPPGARDSMKLRVPGKGHQGTAGRGDLYVLIRVVPGAVAPSTSMPPSTVTFTPQRPVAPAQRSPKPQDQTLNLDASAFAPLAGSNIVGQLARLGANSWDIFRSMAGTDNRWWGNRSVIPPSSDPRTRFIDRGMVGQGMITPEELVEIHTVGDQMLTLRPELDQAQTLADQAVQRTKDEHAALKKQKKAEAEERKKKHADAVARRKATDIFFLGRGVSKGLADRRANVEKLQAAGLPVLATPADVATALGVTIPQLRWLAFHSEAATRTHYVRFTVPKKSGGTRELAAPHRRIAAAQRWILTSILRKLKTHPAAHGFVQGRSTRTNALPHTQTAVVINCDLKDFFPTINVHRVLGMFAELGYSPAAATLLALLCTESPRRVVEYAGTTFHVATGPRCLPQGACTSPAISNLIARRLDSRLAGICRKLNFTYTRYADDLTFSAPLPRLSCRKPLRCPRTPRATPTRKSATSSPARGTSPRMKASPSTKRRPASSAKTAPSALPAWSSIPPPRAFPEKPFAASAPFSITPGRPASPRKIRTSIRTSNPTCAA